MGSTVALFTVSVALLFAGVSSFGFGSSKAKEPEWNSLKVTFPKYDPLPRTVDEATRSTESTGFFSSIINWFKSDSTWNNISGSDCTNGGQFNGFRYLQGNDTSMNLLFDSQGTVAGIQMNMPKSQLIVPENNYPYANVPMYQSNTINGVDMYTLTAYFVDPATICTTGRANTDLDTQGTGTQLFLQNGATPADLVSVPNTRSEAQTQGWSKNTCFIGMGYHNFYQVSQMDATDCSDARPYFLLFNKQEKLHGFGFNSFGNTKSSRYENPPKLAIKTIMGDPVPNCVLQKADTAKISTMHVYFFDIKHVLDVSCL